MKDECKPGLRQQRAIEVAERIKQACRDSKDGKVIITLDDAFDALFHLMDYHYSDSDMELMRIWAKGYFRLLAKEHDRVDEER